MDKKIVAILAVVVVVVVIAGLAVAMSVDEESNKVTEGVNYHGNGGHLSNGNDLYGLTSHSVSENMFTNGDARFTSWNTKADGTGTTYHVGDYIDFASGKTVDLYAIWNSSSTFSVVSVFNHFTMYYEGQKLTMLTVLDLPSSGSMDIVVQAAASGGVFSIVENDIIRYQIDDGTSIKEYMLALVFTGTTDCNVSLVDGSPVVRIGFDGSQDVTMGGIDSFGSHSKGITYNGNGGHTADGKSRFTEASHTAAPGSTFICDGKTFKSWNTSKDGTGTSYAPGDDVPYTGYAALFAIWV